jgi:hypothetical protein
MAYKPVCMCRHNKVCGACYSGLYRGVRTVDKPLRREELAGLYDGVLRDEDGRTPQPEFSEFQETIDPNLVNHLKKVGVELYFSYPADKLDEMKRLFESRDKTLHIRPLATPKPTTTTFRGGCSATIEFETPKDPTCLNQYPAAVKQYAENPNRIRIFLNDYKLALQLFFNHGFELNGPRWQS